MKNVLTILLLSGSVCFAARPKLAPELQAQTPHGSVRVIVQWKQTPATAQHQKVLNRGGKWLSTLTSIRAGVYTVPATALSDLANDSDVAYIAPDRAVTAKLDYTAAAISAATAWKAGATGSGIGVAIIDSGINADSDLGTRIVYTHDFLGGNGQDQFGHGQHVAGIVASSGQSTSASDCPRVIKGIAPAAKLINLRVLDANGEGTDSNVIAAIEMAISLKTKYNIRVINLSLGRPVFESYTQDPLCQAVEAAWKAGIVVVVAAGNDGRDNSFGTDGYGTIMAPGNDPYVITVGAMKTEETYDRTDDLIASYSSKGPTQIDHVVKPDIVAPGNQVTSLLASNSTLQNNYPQNQTSVRWDTLNLLGLVVLQNSHAFFTLSGTSMATPAVSGAVADLLQAQPALTPDQVKARLMKTAYKSFPGSSTAIDPTTGQSYTSYYDIFTVGAGYLDLAAALADKSVATGSALSPVANYDPASGAITVTFGNDSVWNSDTDYAARYVWSDNAVWGSATVSGASTVLTYNAVSSDRCIWTTNAIWSNRCIWSADSLSNQRCVWSSDVPGFGEQ